MTFPYKIEYKRWESEELKGFTAIAKCTMTEQEAMLSPPDQYALLAQFRKIMEAEFIQDGIPSVWGWRRAPQVQRDTDFETAAHYFIFTARGFYSKVPPKEGEESEEAVSATTVGMENKLVGLNDVEGHPV